MSALISRGGTLDNYRVVVDLQHILGSNIITGTGWGRGGRCGGVSGSVEGHPRLSEQVRFPRTPVEMGRVHED